MYLEKNRKKKFWGFSNLIFFKFLFNLSTDIISLKHMSSIKQYYFNFLFAHPRHTKQHVCRLSIFLPKGRYIASGNLIKLFLCIKIIFDEPFCVIQLYNEVQLLKYSNLLYNIFDEPFCVVQLYNEVL